jgi:hypothetical protein
MIKASLFVFTLTLTFATSALAVQDQKDVAVRSPSETKASGNSILGIGSGIYPTASGRNFSVVKGGAGTGLDVGCSGVDLENLLRSYFNVDFKSLGAYISANAAGFALTYLIYSNPTLYSLLQDLKRAGDFALNANMLTCNQVRSMGDKARNRAITAKAMDKCAAEQGPNGCQDGSVLAEEYKRKAVDEYERELKPKSYNANATVNDFLTHEMELSPELRDLMGTMLPNESVSGGNISKTSPTKTVSSMMRESYDVYLDKMKKLVESKRSGKLKDYGQLGEYANSEGIEPVSRQALEAIANYPPDEREVIIQRLAARQAYGEVVSKIRKVSEVVRVAMLKGDKDVALFDYQKVDVRNALAVLDNMIRSVKLEYDALDDQRVFMLNILKQSSGR